jgi:hypothetical protein
MVITIKRKKMKKTINRILSVVLVIVVISGCSKLSDFGDTNLNPAATTDPITSALLTNVLSGMSGYATSTRDGAYCQYFSETQYTDLSLYSLPQISSDGAYPGSLYDLENIIINNTDDATKEVASLGGANENQIAIAKIVQSYIYWTITDRWDEVPYTDALKGDPNVTFDTQETIYKGMISTLTEAAGMITSGGAAIKGDILYNGDMAKWKKLANSMRVLMAIRLSNRYPGAAEYAATELKAALAASGGVIENNSDNWASYPPGGNFRNNWYATYDGRKDWAMSKEMADRMVAISDARQAVYGSSAVGVPYGLLRNAAEAFTSANPDWAYIFAPSYREETDPTFLVTAAHVYLARAEAADRGWTTENAITMYEAGITASHAQWGITPAGGYLAANGLAFAQGTNANLDRIALQQYIAFYPDGRNGWANWRRTDVPTLTPTPNATNASGEIPRRYLYGSSERGTAGDAVDAAEAKFPAGVEPMDVPVWWENK